MADEEYWHSRRRRLADSKWGPLAFVPMEEAALLGNGPHLAVSAAFEFLLLDMPTEANKLLEFVPRLRSALQLPHALSAFPEHQQRVLAAEIREYLLLGLWLRSGEIDPALAEDAYDHLVALNRWWTSGRFTGANLLHLMLLAIEAGKPDCAVADYLAHETNPHDLSAKKLSTNARTLLYAHLIANNDGRVSDETLAAARDRFRNAARNWRKGLQPIPYVGQLELARTLRVCAILTNQSLSIAELLRQVRGA